MRSRACGAYRGPSTALTLTYSFESRHAIIRALLTGYAPGRRLLGTHYSVHNPTRPGIMNQPTRLHHRVRGFVPTVAMLLPLAGIAGACSNDSTSMPTAIAPSSLASFGKNVSGSNQKILFSSTRDGNHEVYSINPDGTGETRLTNDVAVDQAAVWSPDGKRIAFHSTRDNRLGEIYVMNADGTEVARLTNSIGSSDEPSWSKDGKQIVFTSTRDAADPANALIGDVDLYVMNADGSGVIRLTADHVNDSAPVFSPDGRSIAFTSTRDHPDAQTISELYLMNVDGTNVTRLTFQNNGRLSHPSWDPHSRRLAVAISNSGADNGIYTLSLDVLGLTRLTFDPNQGDDFPSWSADNEARLHEPSRWQLRDLRDERGRDGADAPHGGYERRRISTLEPVSRTAARRNPRGDDASGVWARAGNRDSGARLSIKILAQSGVLRARRSDCYLYFELLSMTKAASRVLT